MLPGVETLFMLCTGIEFQACVDSDVTNSPSFLTEGFSTLAISIGLFTTMDSSMNSTV